MPFDLRRHSVLPYSSRLASLLGTQGATTRSGSCDLGKGYSARLPRELNTSGPLTDVLLDAGVAYPQPKPLAKALDLNRRLRPAYLPHNRRPSDRADFPLDSMDETTARRSSS